MQNINEDALENKVETKEVKNESLKLEYLFVIQGNQCTNISKDVLRNIKEHAINLLMKGQANAKLQGKEVPHKINICSPDFTITLYSQPIVPKITCLPCKSIS